jgi:hypothetical protein
MKNPIIDNRIVSDKTFAVRLYNFIRQTETNDIASEEEQNYLLGVATRLLEYQIKTSTTEEEKQYFKNLGL